MNKAILWHDGEAADSRRRFNLRRVFLASFMVST